MISKIIKGRGFRGAAEYLTGGVEFGRFARGALIDTNLTGATPRQWAKEVAAFRQLRPTLGKAVFHGCLSLSAEDRRLSAAEWQEIARRYLAGLGFVGCPFIVVRHGDTDHDHCHLLALRITPRGETVSDKNDYKRAEALVRELERDFGLVPIPTSSHHNPKEDTMDKQAIETRLEASSNAAREILATATVLPDPVIDAAEALTEKQRRERRRQLLDQEYQDMLRSKLGDWVRHIHAHPGGLTLYAHDYGYIKDSGDSITAHGMNTARSADRLIDLAIAKGWGSVVLRGNEFFLREAMAIAVRRGLPVQPLDDYQLAIWLEVQQGGSGAVDNGLAPQPSAAPTPSNPDAIGERLRARRDALAQDNPNAPAYPWRKRP